MSIEREIDATARPPTVRAGSAAGGAPGAGRRSRLDGPWAVHYKGPWAEDRG